MLFSLPLSRLSLRHGITPPLDFTVGQLMLYQNLGTEWVFGTILSAFVNDHVFLSGLSLLSGMPSPNLSKVQHNVVA